jgi:NhaP-type Na+/H+ or K+/H+ antiporter
VFTAFDGYELGLLLLGAAALGAVVLPRLLSERPMSFPVIYVGLGAVVFALPTPFTPIDLPSHPHLVARITEVIIIVALMGIGLRLDRRFSWRGWAPTWRLLGIAMPLTVVGVALTGAWLLRLPMATAVLLGAVLAPTDPVLASDVQSGEPSPGDDDTVRFGLTSEAGLNDGLAFPFAYGAIALAASPGVDGVLVAEWLAVAVVAKVAIGIAVGWVVGRVIAWLIFRDTTGRSALAQTTEGLIALSATFLTYGAAEVAQGYGFIAVFVTGLTVRQCQPEHGYHRVLHRFTDQLERLLTALFMVLLGGAVVQGLISDITWPMVLTVAIVLFVVRPLAAGSALMGSEGGWPEKALISFFGIRGLGSLYYLGFAVHEGDLADVERLWPVVGLTVLTSVLMHGVTAYPAMRRFDAWRESRLRPAGGPRAAGRAP